MITNRMKNILIMIISIFVIIGIIIAVWLSLDLSSKIDVLKSPEKYSFRTNFASFITQNDYYFAKYPDETDTFYNELKIIEKKYENKTDFTSQKIKQLNNEALDLYHDVLSLHITKTKISDEDFIFINKNCKQLASFFMLYLTIYPELEKRSELYNELKMRKEAVSIVKNDLRDRKINATVTLNDVKYENLTPAYLSNNEPDYAKEFRKEFENGQKNIHDEINTDLDKALKSAKNKDEKFLIKFKYSDKIHSKYTMLIDNLNIKWKHRYVISAIEYKNNKEDRITHLYEVYPYKEGNRIYWNIQYHSPNSEFLKAYLKMLELLINF